MKIRPALLMVRATAAALMLAVAGCATDGGARAGAQDGATAECAVCRENADLACLKVKVRDNTPRADYAGKTYYFCSEECLESFKKNPGKFATK